MIKEVNTFHSGGRYLFSSDITIDMSVLNEAVNVLSLMPPLFPEIIAEYNNELIEKAIFNEASLENIPVTLQQVKQIIRHDRSNFSQDSNAVTTINLFIAHTLIRENLTRSLDSELISVLHKELVTGLPPNILDTEGNYRKGGSKADEKWITVPYAPPPGSPLDINFLIKNLIEWLNNEASDLNPPIVTASLLHMHIKKIQPYNNANASLPD